MAEVDRHAWNALVGTSYPFLRHEFLLAMETSGATSTASGWTPCHLLLESGTALVGCLPLYVRSNSYGEYVFDWAWADAYRQHGLAYYPKLVSAIPFTPCAGPRLSLAPSLELATVLPLVLEAIIAKADALGASSWHLLFPEAQQKSRFSNSHLLLRTGCQYQWFNRGYTNYDDYLSTLTSRKRKNLRKERTQVSEQGIVFRVLEGPDVSPDQWQAFYYFYQNTYLVRGRQPYLNASFFTTLAQTMPEALLLVLAYRDDACVAGALFFKGSDTLYGRYWGSSEEFQFLHFETCYYQGIDYCISHGYQRFDSGAQGEHKIQRGFEPVPTWSLHWIAHPQFRAAIARFVEEEEAHINAYREHAAGFLPFRKDLNVGGANGE